MIINLQRVILKSENQNGRTNEQKKINIITIISLLNNTYNKNNDPIIENYNENINFTRNLIPLWKAYKEKSKTHYMIFQDNDLSIKYLTFDFTNLSDEGQANFNRKGTILDPNENNNNNI